MMKRIKALSHKKFFAIGLMLIFIGGLLPYEFRFFLLRAVIWGIAFILVLYAHDKRVSTRKR
ncbi:hypothetical protein [Thalassobacillus hwangdonensis]|uniref:Uncharacterized protein n=1 Tax=Thalassobacillus hwangdonensis TaxID=546108 RepID=A0ABW3L4Z8_9BACI